MVAPGCGDPGRNACPRTTDIAQLTAQMQLDQGILRENACFRYRQPLLHVEKHGSSFQKVKVNFAAFQCFHSLQKQHVSSIFPIFFVRKSACSSFLAKGEVACDMVEDYLPNGTSLGLVQPSVKCAASYDQCPCRET